VAAVFTYLAHICLVRLRRSPREPVHHRSSV
jgi:hypothetical protein